MLAEPVLCPSKERWRHSAPKNQKSRTGHPDEVIYMEPEQLEPRFGDKSWVWLEQRGLGEWGAEAQAGRGSHGEGPSSQGWPRLQPAPEEAPPRWATAKASGFSGEFA